MKNKLIAVAFITALLCMIAGNSIACTTPVIEYHLTIDSTDGGDVSKPGEGRFSYCPQQGDRVVLVAVPYPDYHFVNWTGDVGTIADANAAVTTITVDNDYSITANFAKPYSLTTSSTEGGSVTTPGEGTFIYDEGDVAKLVATPDPGYGFVNWTGDVGTLANVDAASTSITMNADYSLTANFEELAEYDLTISSTSGGSVTIPGEGIFTYYDGTVVNLVATANSGYYFVNWTGDVGTIANVNAPTTTITMSDNYSITANFRRIPAGKVALTTSSTAGGSVTTPGEGAFLYNVGEVVGLVASPASGYRFVDWTGNVGTVADANAASTTITMNGDYSITANFVAVYDLTISSTAGGLVTIPGVGTFSYDEGTVVNLVAAAQSFYYFTNWTGDVDTVAGVNSATTTITMNDDYSITANFEQSPPGQVTLTTSSTAGGSVTTPGEGAFSYDVGEVVSLVASPVSGYGFVNWTGDVGTIANVNAASTSITMNDDYSITANFQQLAEYDLTTSSTTGGSVTVPGEGTFTYYDGTVVNLVATANSGYYFTNWTGDVGTITNVNGPTTTITMNDNYSITANFEQTPPGQVALTTSSTAGGSVTTPGEGAFLYNVGEVASLVASPVSGYGFVNWTGDVGTLANVNAASTTITMNGDYSIMANFEELAEYDLTTSSTTGGSVTVPGEGTFTYYDGTVVNLVATANSGYYFTNWTGDVGTITNVNGPTTTITMNDNYSITANFEQTPPGQVALTTSSMAGGSVTTPGEATFTYDEGTMVDLMAEAEEGYGFVNWTGDVGTIANVNAASTSITMNDDYSITANFVKLVQQYDLTVSSTNGGSVTVPGEGTFTFDEGTVVNLVAEAVPGYYFTNWTGDVGTVAYVNAATTTITINGDYTITANFVDP